MRSFELREDFYMDNAPFKIISGSIHYFRVVPEYWRDRLEKLKNMGCNTVETYVPWNVHEPFEGEFVFEGIANLKKFVLEAASLDLFVILRPSPYICAEWEFGGLPYWLLKENSILLRSSNHYFLEKSRIFLSRVIKEVRDLQITKGGPIILFQVENEFGGFGNDTEYLTELYNIMISEGIETPMITSDGPWGKMLENGSIPDLALPTINCGSDISKHFDRLRRFHGRTRPLMVTEFWIGWFDAWGDGFHHRTDEKASSFELREALSQGSVNIYMFHGGTNFGFMNGANYYEKLLPDVTSYDYDAPLSESGEMTPKYWEFKRIISKFSKIKEVPLSTRIKKIAPIEIGVTRISTFKPEEFDSKIIKFPQNMEALDCPYGYIYYEKKFDSLPIEKIQIPNAADRIKIYINDILVETQYDTEIGRVITLESPIVAQKVGILVENMGRVNYSYKIVEQRKGVLGTILINNTRYLDWNHLELPLSCSLQNSDYSENDLPKYFQFDFELSDNQIGDGFIDTSEFGKGVIIINNFNLGRYWSKGPQKRLYLPAPLLKEGENTIVVLETEGVRIDMVKIMSEGKLE